ncbi:hypothetical protein LTR17_020163 [Elasticomyces elasticus]|nr:hypothetical protein LTR17_020163 [Elasticomyces elasticus]
MWPVYLLVGVLVAYLGYNRFLHPLNKVPGPFLASISPLWLAWQCMHRRRPRLDLDLHKRYSSVVRIAPDHVIFSNPVYFKAVYGAGTKFTKSRWYEAPTDATTKPSWDNVDMLIERDTAKLGVQKRLAVPVYNNSERHQNLMDNNIRRWHHRLQGLTKRPLDMYSNFELLIVDMMSEVTFAVPFGAVESGNDGGHMHTMWSLWRWWGWIGFLPTLNMLDLRFSPYRTYLRPGMKLPVFPFCGGKIGAYFGALQAGESYPPCILDDFQKLSHDKPEFRPSWAAKLPMTSIGAGVDTISQSLAAVVAGVSRNKSVYERLLAELDAAVKVGKISKGQPVPCEVAGQMEYLQACIREAMRMWPNIAIALPRIVPTGGIELDGYYISAGQTVGMNPRQLGRNEEIFGADPESFQPERWLKVSSQRRNDMEMYNLAFGGPSRKCPGMRLAYVVLSKVLASLFLDFHIETLNEIDGAPGPGGGKWVEEGSESDAIYVVFEEYADSLDNRISLPTQMVWMGGRDLASMRELI